MIKGIARSLALSTALLGGVTIVAMAADPFVESSVHDWSGFYIGAHAGYGEADVHGIFDMDDFNQDDDTFFDDGEGPFDLNLDGFAGGGQLGVNWQSGNLVLGVEADLSIVDWSDSITSDANSDESVSAETDFVGTLRGRAGVAMDNFLLFGTAGVAITDTEFTAVDTDEDDERGSVDFNDIGLVVGGGAEWAFDENWSIKAEGLYGLFGDHKDTSNLNGDSDLGDFAELEDMWMARVGINFHF